MKIHEVEQGSDEWHKLRAGKPTASEFSKLITSKGEPSKQMAEYAIQLAADLYAGEPQDRWQGNEWTERGHEMEDRARAYYENTFDTRAVMQVGFITDDAERWGASPDSLVDDDGLLEIKCLKANRHVGAHVFFERNGRIPSEYIAQVQGQLFVSGRKWCDSLFWHPELPALICRHRPDEKIQINLGLQLKSCLDERKRIIDILNNA